MSVRVGKRNRPRAHAARAHNPYDPDEEPHDSINIEFSEDEADDGARREAAAGEVKADLRQVRRARRRTGDYTAPARPDGYESPSAVAEGSVSDHSVASPTSGSDGYSTTSSAHASPAHGDSESADASAEWDLPPAFQYRAAELARGVAADAGAAAVREHDRAAPAADDAARRDVARRAQDAILGVRSDGLGAGGALIDGEEDEEDEKYYKAVTPHGWGPPALSSLSAAHRDLENKADARVPPFCFMCDMTQRSRRDLLSASDAVPDEYKRLVEFVHLNIHRLDYAVLCYKVQARYLRSIVPALCELDEKRDGPARRPMPRPQGAAAGGGDRPRKSIAECAEMAGHWYWSLRQIYDHHKFHAPNARLILEESLRALNIENEALMTGGVHLRNSRNGNRKTDLRAMKMRLQVHDRRVKVIMMLAQMQPDKVI